MKISRDFADILPAAIGILIAMAVIPFCYMKNVAFPLAIISLYALIVYYCRFGGAPYILVAMSLCLPCVSDDGNSFITSPRNFYFYLFVRLLISVMFITYFLRGKQCKPLMIVALPIIIVSFFYSAFLSSSYEISQWINMLIYVPIFFMICYWDKMKFQNVCRLFDIMFLITMTYSILDTFFHISPYQIIIDSSSTGNLIDMFVLRSRGLLCNPLLIAMVVLFYQALLFIRRIILGRKNYLLLVLSFIFSILTISRTAILGSIILMFLYFILDTNGRKRMIIPFVIIIAVVMGASLLLKGYIGANIDRFDESFFDSHRFGAFQTVSAILKDYPLGVGSENISDMMDSYASGGLIIDFGTLDNFFLTILASYGVFSIVYYFFYVATPLMFTLFGKIKMAKVKWKSLLMVYVTWCIISFSFDLEAYMTTLLITNGILGAVMSYGSRGHCYGMDKL